MMTIWRMRIACWITKARHTRSECAILIAFPLQQWLHERVLVLRYTCIACIIISLSSFADPEGDCTRGLVNARHSKSLT